MKIKYDNLFLKFLEFIGILVLAGIFLFAYSKFGFFMHSSTGGNICNGKTYEDCEQGTFLCLEHAGICDNYWSSKQLMQITYTNQNYCNELYYPDCKYAGTFSCNEEKGGICTSSFYN